MSLLRIFRIRRGDLGVNLVVGRGTRGLILGRKAGAQNPGSQKGTQQQWFHTPIVRSFGF